MKTKRFFSLLMCAALVFTLWLPMTAYAADVKLQAGLPEIKSGHNNTAANSTVLAFGGMQWAVIGYNGSGVASESNTATLLLASDQSYGAVAYDTASRSSANYEGSNLQKCMNLSVLPTIPAKEQALIKPRTLTSADGISGPNAVDQKLWPLSLAEANSLSSMGTSKAYVPYYVTHYWLRSPGIAGQASTVNINPNVAYYIDGEGYPFTIDWIYVRPAFKLNLADVLFTSATAGGKSVNVGGHLWMTKPTSGALKLTVKDSDTGNLSLDATASLSKTTAQPGETVSVAFSGAKTGANKYVSCVLTDTSGKVLYYAKLSQAASGTAGLEVPALENGDYKIKLFNEQANGNNNTDFCSAPVALSITVYSVPGSLKAGANLSGTAVYFGKFNGAPIKWTVVSKSPSAAILWTTASMASMKYSNTNGRQNWSGSDVCKWLNGTDSYTSTGFLPNAFTVPELSAITNYGTTERANPQKVDGQPIDNATIDISQKIVLPSIAELGNGDSGPGDYNSDIGTGTWNVNQGARAFGSWWWLRSPGFSGDPGYAAIVENNGSICSGGQVATYEPYQLRPAFKLNLANVLLITAAAGGKPTSTGTLSSMTAPTAAVKLTVQSASQTLDVCGTTVQSAQTGSVLSFSYANATTGSGQYVSCVLQDSATGETKYYGKLANCASAAAGILSIPLTGVANGIYTLKLFSEQANGDNLTDVCSAPVAMTVAVAGGQGTVSNFGGAINDTPSVCTVTFDSQGGDSVAAQTVSYKGLVIKPADPAKPGNIFGGWYRESACSNAWDFSLDEVAANITLFARWIQVVPVGLACEKTDATRYGAADGSITAAAAGGNSGTYEYSLDGAAWQSAGSFTGLAAGTYAVTARDAANTANVSAPCSVTIGQPGMTPVGITCSSTNAARYNAAAGTITVTATGGNSGTFGYSIDGGVSWQDSGAFTGLKAGTYVVLARDAANTANVSAPSSVSISQPRLAGTYLANKMPAKANAGTAWIVKPAKAPKGYTLKSVSVKSSSSSVAPVDANEVVTFLKGGKVKLTVTMIYQKGKLTKTVKITRQVTVKQLASALSLNTANAAIVKGKTLKLKAAILPSSATVKVLKWTSSNKKVAVVSSAGVVSAKGRGTCVITCTTTDGSRISVACTITVK